MAEIKVYIVEDDPIIAEEIASCLRRNQYEIIGISYSAEEVTETLLQKSVDIVLIDINLNGNPEGINLAAQIKTELQLPFIFITSYSDKKTLEMAKETLPSGYVVKPFAEAGLLATLEIALYNYNQENKDKFPDLNLHKINQQIPSPITAREFEILSLIYEGHSNSKIADLLFVSQNTVKAHIKNAYLKLDVVSRSTVFTKLREMMLK